MSVYSEGQGDDGSGREQPRARGGGGHEEQYGLGQKRESSDHLIPVDNRGYPRVCGWVVGCMLNISSSRNN